MAEHHITPFSQELLSKETLISDSDIREILNSWHEFKDKRLRKGTYVHIGKLADAQCLTVRETDVWNDCFNLSNELMRRYQEGTLFAFSELEDQSTTPQSVQTSDTVSVYLDVPTSGRLEPCNPNGCSFYLRQRIEIMPKEADKDNISYANVRIDIFAKDAQGRWIVGEQEGVTVDGQPFRPDGQKIYIPKALASARIVSNTLSLPFEENTISINPVTSDDHSLVLRSFIHDINAIKNLPIPKDKRIQGLFWQLAQNKAFEEDISPTTSYRLPLGRRLKGILR